MTLRFALTVTLLLTALLVAPAARASLVYCNRTETPIEAAVGYRGPIEDGTEDWIAEGWWKIAPGQCARVYSAALEQRFYFYYAIATIMGPHDTQPFSWAGKYQFCADNKAFRSTGDGNCEARGLSTKNFQQLDIKPGTKDYTLDFRLPG